MKIYSINVSEKKGMLKKPAAAACLVEGLGIYGDAHAAPGDRQLSLLAFEDMQSQSMEFKPGMFAENITTLGIDLTLLKVGDRLSIGEAVIEISKIGKECHTRCAVYHKTGFCIMPTRGIFAAVIKGGRIKDGDKIEVLQYV